MFPCQMRMNLMAQPHTALDMMQSYRGAVANGHRTLKGLSINLPKQGFGQGWLIWGREAHVSHVSSQMRQCVVQLRS